MWPPSDVAAPYRGASKPVHGHPCALKLTFCGRNPQKMPRNDMTLGNWNRTVAAFVIGALALPPAGRAEEASRAEIKSAAPGTVLRIWPLEGGVDPGYKGYRILYRSTGIDGEPIAVSGAVLFPAAAASGPRPVLAWAHPTTGVKTACAPTLNGNLASTIPGIDVFTDAGYVIAATDYAGLGAPGVHPYLVGASAARAVLDSIRAARNVRDSHAGAHAAVWGHSQGGHAALFTGAEAARYAPEIKIVGVATAAPATDLVALFEADRPTSSGRSLTAMALYSWSRIFAFPITDFASPRAEPVIDRIAGDCLETIEGIVRESDDERALGPDFLARDPAADPRIRDIMLRNSTGPVPGAMPVFIAQHRRRRRAPRHHPRLRQGPVRRRRQGEDARHAGRVAHDGRPRCGHCRLRLDRCPLQGPARAERLRLTGKAPCVRMKAYPAPDLC
jgi:hypothetical protein